MTGTVPRCVDDAYSTGDRQLESIGEVAVDLGRLDRYLIGPDEQTKQDLWQQSGRRRKRPAALAAPHERGIERVHVGRSAGDALELGHAAGVIGMAVGDENAAHVRRLSSQLSQRGRDFACTIRQACVDECDAVVIDDEHVHGAERYLPESVDDFFRGHHPSNRAHRVLDRDITGHRDTETQSKKFRFLCASVPLWRVIVLGKSAIEG